MPINCANARSVQVRDAFSRTQYSFYSVVLGSLSCDNCFNMMSPTSVAYLAYSTPTEAAGGTGAGSGNGWSRQSPSGRDSPLPAAVAGAAAPNPGAVARESCTGSLCVPLVEHVWRCVAVARLTTSICVVLVQIHITTEDRDSWLKNATVAVFFQDAQSFLHNPLFGRDS